MADVRSSFDQIRQGVNGLLDAAEGLAVEHLPAAAAVTTVVNPEGRSMVGDAVDLGMTAADRAGNIITAEVRADVEETAWYWGIKWGALLVLGPILGSMMEGPVKWFIVFNWFVLMFALHIVNTVKLLPGVGIGGAILHGLAAIPRAWGSPFETLAAFAQILKKGATGGVDSVVKLNNALTNETGWHLVCCAYLAAGTFTRLIWGTLYFPDFSAIYLFLVNAAGANNFDAFGHRLIRPTGHMGFKTTEGEESIRQQTYKNVTPAAQEFIRWLAILTCVGVLVVSWIGGIEHLLTPFGFGSAAGHNAPAVDAGATWLRNLTNTWTWDASDSWFRRFGWWAFPTFGILILLPLACMKHRWWKSPGFMAFLFWVMALIYTPMPWWLAGVLVIAIWIIMKEASESQEATAH